MISAARWAGASQARWVGRFSAASDIQHPRRWVTVRQIALDVKFPCRGPDNNLSICRPAPGLSRYMHAQRIFLVEHFYKY